jgi:hypothetical protein
MTPAVAARLKAQAGDPAMRTQYTFLSAGEAGHAFRELGVGRADGGHAGHVPRGGPHAGKGVIDRMAVIGQRITHADETVSARPALAAEAERLKIRPARPCQRLPASITRRRARLRPRAS